MSLAAAVLRAKVLYTRTVSRMGLRQDSGLIILAVIIGSITSVAAVTFHELIDLIRRWLYETPSEQFLYGRGIWLLALFPAVGGLLVGIISKYILRGREGHGVVDVMESIIRSRGFVKPLSAIEKIITSALTIGSGGSSGAEGPIVQIGAAISSFVGNTLRINRMQMPLLVGCGSAAGISAIFHSPIGGVLFTLEVILQDFSIRAFTPVVVASVVANVVTQSVYHHFGKQDYRAIFSSPSWVLLSESTLSFTQAMHFAVLGIACGIIGLVFVRTMFRVEKIFLKFSRLGAFRPALGGLILGLMGIAYILVFAHLTGMPKPISSWQYTMPAFYSDGYGVIRAMLEGSFNPHATMAVLFGLLITLIVLKILGTSITLGSGGSGGVIAPSLFIGATAGLTIAFVFQSFGATQVLPHAMVLVGMAAVLSAVVHAPLASILIIFELTRDSNVIVPAMLSTVIATSIAKLLFPDSVYTHSLRHRGLVAGSVRDLSVLRRLNVENVGFEPMVTVLETEKLETLIDRLSVSGLVDSVVVNATGQCAGMLIADDLRFVLMNRDAIPLLTVKDVMRSRFPTLDQADDLVAALNVFSESDLDIIPVISKTTKNPIGLFSRATMMREYHKHITGD